MSEWTIDSDGELVKHPDAYKDVTPETIKQAQDGVTLIAQIENNIEVNFLQLARVLDTFERDKLYLARSYPTFIAWAKSDELRIGPRLAHDLIRIVREALPILVDADRMDLLPPVSKMRALLPLLSDDQGKEKFLEAAAAVAPLTVDGTKAHVREMRGITDDISSTYPAMFKMKVRRGESFHRVTMHCQDGVDYYTIGTVHIKPEHWPRWSNLFGEHNIEYEGE